MTTRGPGHAGTSGQPLIANRTTRSASKQVVPPSPVESSGSPGEKKKKQQTAGEQARGALTAAKCLGTEEQVAPGNAYTILARILGKFREGISDEAKLALQAFAALLQAGEDHEYISNKMMDAIAKRVESKIENVMDNGLAKMSGMVESVIANQREIQEASADLAGKTEALQKLARVVESSAKVTSTSSDQLTNTVTSYKEALLSAGNTTPRNSATQSPTAREDPRLTRDLDRKQRQFLLEMGKEVVEGKSVTELKEKIDAVLSSLTPTPPEGAKVQEINKLRNGGIIIQLATKEAADWLREPFNKHAFTSELDTNAHIKDRAFPILVPRVPLTFDPSNQEHLREVEGANNLAPNTINKARWIKPVYRRHPKQRFAYATLSLNSAHEANRLIRDGLYVCSNRTYPKRLKYEPKQCMKCRKWGHFASECNATIDTCGTCGEDHGTRECVKEGKRYCVACRTNDHASWDRSCPEFQRKSAQFDEMHPENALTYFPTEESWTLTARPERIPLDDRFPSKYAVGSLPPPNRTKKQMPTREIERRQKKKQHNSDGTQRTLDRYVEKRVTETQTRPGDEGTQEANQGNRIVEVTEDTQNQNTQCRN
jgi:hypothetical protein